MSYVPMQMYTLAVDITNPGAVTNLQMKAHATKPFCVLAVRIYPLFSLTTNTYIPIQLGVIPTAFGTVTALASSDADPYEPKAPATGLQFSTTTTGHTATAEPTYGRTWKSGYNTMGGAKQNRLPVEIIVVSAAEGFAVKHLVAPPAGSYRLEIDYGEIG